MVTRLSTVLGTHLGTEIGGMGDVVVDTNMYGFNNATVANFYATPSPGGDASGGATGYYEGVLFRVPVVPASATRALGGRDSNGAVGHGFASTSTAAALFWGVTNTIGGRTNTPQYTAISSNLNKLILAVGVWLDGSFSRLYVAGVRVGTQTAHAATMQTGSLATTLGKRIADGLPATGMDFFGLIQGTGVPTDAEMATHYAACVSARQLVALTGAAVTSSTVYDITSKARAQGGTLPAAIGQANDMLRNGSPTLVTEPNPSWV